MTVLKALPGVNQVSAAAFQPPSGTTYQVVDGLLTVSNPSDLPYVIGRGCTPQAITTGDNPTTNVATINAALAQGGDYYISGTVPIDSSLLNASLFGARLFGVGGWGSTTRTNVGGTVLFWVGPSGLPMYVHQSDFGGGVFNVLFKGDSTAPPLCAILLDTGEYSIVTNSYSNPSENKNCTEGIFDNIWIGESFGLDTDPSINQFTNGIMLTGTINGDTHNFGMVYIAGVSGTGVLNKNPNAGAINFNTLLVKKSTNCIDTIAPMVITNLYCTSTDFNFLLRDTGALDINLMFTENGGGIAKFLAGPIAGYNLNLLQKLCIYNGYFQMLASGHTSPYLLDVTTSKQWVITLTNFVFTSPVVNPITPVINLANTSDGFVYGIFNGSIQSTLGNLSIANNIVTGTQSQSDHSLVYGVGAGTGPLTISGLLGGQVYSAHSSTNAAAFLNSVEICGGSTENTLGLTGAISGVATAALPPVTALLSNFPNLLPGSTYKLRVKNDSSYAWTLSNAISSQAITNLNLNAGGPAPSWDSSGQMFGSACLDMRTTQGYGDLTSGFPIWPGNSGAVQLWINQAVPPGSTQRVLVMGGAGGLIISILSSGFLSIGYGVNGISGVTNLCDGAWHCIEVDFIPTGMFFYVDGIFVGTLAKIASTNLAAGAFYLGVGSALNLPWTGEIDEVSVWSAALHTGRTSWTPPVAPWVGTEANLLALYHLDGDFTNSVTAGSGYGWTLNGNMVVPVNGWSDFYVTIGASQTAVLQYIGDSTLAPAFTPPTYPGPANDFTAQGTLPVGETILWGVATGGIPNAVRLTTDGSGLANSTNCLNMAASISSMVVTIDVYVEGISVVSAMWSSVSIYAYRSGNTINVGSSIPTGAAGGGGAPNGSLLISADNTNLGINITYVAPANNVNPAIVIGRVRSVLMGAPPSVITKPSASPRFSASQVPALVAALPLAVFATNQNQMGPNYNSGTPGNSGPWQ